jgi:hypothetical protein
MKQGSPPPTNDPFAQGPVHNDTGFPASTSTHPSSQPSSPDLPYDYEYPSTATSSSFEIEHDSMEDVDVDANTNTNTFTEPANAMDRIRRGISKQYSTVTGRQQFEEEDAFRHARKSTLLSVEVSEQQQQKDPSSRQRQIFLTSVDLDTIEQLDADYERALLQREIGWNARYISVRQNVGLSLWFFFVFLMCGTIFFEITTDWSLGESLLFSMYTITTVGYGTCTSFI